MGKTNYMSERITHFVIVMLSILMMILSQSYGLGTLGKPGAGLYPFAIGLFIFPLSLSLFISSLRSQKKGSILNWEGTMIFLSFVGACVFWIMAMPYLGYPVVTLLATFFLCKIMKLEGWLKPFILSAGTALFIFILFDYWLYIDLPRGFLG
ncbi:MAG: tripartite tricarboxylate transporter TctB family protein [Deltaproteobacteria bacterium]|nr:tripartite tricarboxylate transporter TctB family protein [Deltaproteobacteria bacterium]